MAMATDDYREVKNPMIDKMDLRAMWSLAASHRERIMLEGKMWELVTREERRLIDSRTWLSKQFGYSGHQSEARIKLRNAGPDFEPLWGRIDGPERMIVGAAAEVVNRTRLRAVAEDVSMSEALLRELRDYDSWALVQTPEGTFRKRPQRPRGFARQERVRAPSKMSSGRLGLTRELWAAVRAALKRVVEAELAGVADAHARETLRSQAEAEVSAMIDMLHSRVLTAKRSAPINGAPAVKTDVSRKELRAACHLLSVDAPRVSEHVDLLTYQRAKKNFKRLAREYHPDVSGVAKSDPTYEAVLNRYREVVTAMETIEKSYQAVGSATKPEDEV